MPLRSSGPPVVPPRPGSRAGSIQGVNSLLLIVFAAVLLYLLARTQVSEPITWLMQRLQSAISQ
jgi:hypothetical protein